MAYSVADVFAEVKENVPSFYPTGADVGADPTTEAQALAILNKAQVDLMRIVDLYDEEEVILTLTQGVAKYVRDPDLIRVNAAAYQSAFGSGIPLRETSVDRMDTDYRGWRQYSPPSQPFEYYTQGQSVGLYPPPAQTTLGGYPRVVLYAVTRHDFTDLSDLLPPQIDKIDAYVFATCVHWCVRNDRNSLPLYVPLADAAANDLQTFVRRTLIRQKDQVRSNTPFPVGA